MIRHLISALGMLVIIVVSFVCISLLAIEQNKDKPGNSFWELLWGFVPPALILIINALIQFAARQMVLWERHSTYGGSRRTASPHSLIFVLTAWVLRGLCHGWVTQRVHKCPRCPRSSSPRC